MEDTIGRCFEAIQVHNVLHVVANFKAISAELGKRDTLASVPLRLIELIQEAYNSQAIVNTDEGGSAVLACTSLVFASMEKAASAASLEARWLAVVVNLCKFLMRYHVRTLYFFVKSGSPSKAAHVMRIFRGIAQTSESLALELLGRVDWGKMVRLRHFKDGRAKRGAGEELAQVPEDSPRIAYLAFVMALLELNRSDILNHVANEPVIMQTVFAGLTHDGEHRATHTLHQIQTNLLEQSAWKSMAMKMRWQLIRPQHCKAVALLIHTSSAAYGMLRILFTSHELGLLVPADRDLAAFVASLKKTKEYAAHVIKVMRCSHHARHYKWITDVTSASKGTAVLFLRSGKIHIRATFDSAFIVTTAIVTHMIAEIDALLRSTRSLCRLSERVGKAELVVNAIAECIFPEFLQQPFFNQALQNAELLSQHKALILISKIQQACLLVVTELKGMPALFHAFTSMMRQKVTSRLPEPKMLMAIFILHRDTVAQLRRDAGTADVASLRAHDLVMSQLLKCIKQARDLDLGTGSKWSEDSFKLIGEALATFPSEHQVDLLTLNAESLDMKGMVDFPCAWKTLAVIIGIFVNGKDREASSASERLLLEILTRSSVFEGYQEEALIWLHHLRMVGRGCSAELRNTVISFFCQAMYKAIPMYMSLVFTVQEVRERCSKRKTSNGVSRQESFGPVVLVSLQQCISFLKSENRSKEEKVMVSNFVHAVSKDLLLRNGHSLILHQSMRHVMEESKLQSRITGKSSKELHWSLLKAIYEHNSHDALKGGALPQPWSSYDTPSYATFWVTMHRVFGSESGVESEEDRLLLLNYANMWKASDRTRSLARTYPGLPCVSPLFRRRLDAGPHAHVLIEQRLLCQCFGDHFDLIADDERVAFIMGLLQPLLSAADSQALDTESQSWTGVAYAALQSFALLLKYRDAPPKECQSAVTLLMLKLPLEQRGKVNAKILRFFVDMLAILQTTTPRIQSKGDGPIGWKGKLAMTLIAMLTKPQADEVQDKVAELVKCMAARMTDTQMRILTPLMGESFAGHLLTSCGEELPDAFVIQIIAMNVNVQAFVKAIGKQKAFSRSCQSLLKFFRSEYHAKTFQGQASKEVRRFAQQCFKNALKLIFSSQSFEQERLGEARELAYFFCQAREFFDTIIGDGDGDAQTKYEKIMRAWEANKGRLPAGDAGWERSLVPMAVSLDIHRSSARFRSVVHDVCEQSLETYVERLLASQGKKARAGFKGQRDVWEDILEALLILIWGRDISDHGDANLKYRPPSARVQAMIPKLTTRCLRDAFMRPRLFSNLASFTAGLRSLLTRPSLGAQKWLLDACVALLDRMLFHSDFRKMLQLPSESAKMRSSVYCRSLLFYERDAMAKDPALASRRAFIEAMDNLLAISAHHAILQPDGVGDQSSQLHARLLSSFGAGLDRGSQALLRRLGSIKEYGMASTEPADVYDAPEAAWGSVPWPSAYLASCHFLYGESFRIWNSLALGEKGDKASIKAIVDSVHLQSVDARKMVATMHVLLGDATLAQEAYDPVYMLHFAIHHIRGKTVDPEIAICKGFLSLSIVALSSSASETRELALLALNTFAQASPSFAFKQNKLLADLLERLLPTVGGAGESRVPGTTSILIAEMVLLLMYEDCAMHSLAKRWLSRDSTFDQSSIPVFLDMLHSALPGFYKHQRWLLDYLSLGLEAQEDFAAYRKRFAFEVLMGFASNAMSDRSIVRMVLSLIRKAVNIKEYAFELTYKRNLTAWLVCFLMDAGDGDIACGSVIAAVDILAAVAESARAHGWPLGDLALIVLDAMPDLLPLLHDDADALGSLCAFLTTCSRADPEDTPPPSLSLEGVGPLLLLVQAQAKDPPTLAQSLRLACLLVDPRSDEAGRGGAWGPAEATRVTSACLDLLERLRAAQAIHAAFPSPPPHAEEGAGTLEMPACGAAMGAMGAMGVLRLASVFLAHPEGGCLPRARIPQAYALVQDCARLGATPTCRLACAIVVEACMQALALDAGGGKEIRKEIRKHSEGLAEKLSRAARALATGVTAADAFPDVDERTPSDAELGEALGCLLQSMQDA